MYKELFRPLHENALCIMANGFILEDFRKAHHSVQNEGIKFLLACENKIRDFIDKGHYVEVNDLVGHIKVVVKNDSFSRTDPLYDIMIVTGYCVVRKLGEKPRAYYTKFSEIEIFY